MILGVGLDLAPISRMERALARHGGRFEARLFTDEERAYCRARALPAQHFAARFAAKEALLKALRVPPGLTWHEMVVRVEAGGAPVLALDGEAARSAERLGVRVVHLSLTHAADHAAAVVILEGEARDAIASPIRAGGAEQ